MFSINRDDHQVKDTIRLWLNENREALQKAAVSTNDDIDGIQLILAEEFPDAFEYFDAQLEYATLVARERNLNFELFGLRAKLRGILRDRIRYS